MKTLILGLAIAAASLAAASPSLAQTAPAPRPAAAATLPNSFDGPAARPVAAPAPTAAAQAPDVARSTEALRAVVAAAQAGGFDYTAFSPNLAEQVRAREAQFLPLIQGFGALQSVEFVGQERGADLFLLTFDQARTQWIIAFNEEDQIAVLLFRPAPTE